MQDPYVRQAQIEGYRCRSAYKLLEIDQKHKLLKKGSVVVCALLYLFDNCL